MCIRYLHASSYYYDTLPLAFFAKNKHSDFKLKFENMIQCILLSNVIPTKTLSYLISSSWFFISCIYKHK